MDIVEKVIDALIEADDGKCVEEIPPKELVLRSTGWNQIREFLVNQMFNGFMAYTSPERSKPATDEEMMAILKYNLDEEVKEAWEDFIKAVGNERND